MFSYDWPVSIISVTMFSYDWPVTSADVASSKMFTFAAGVRVGVEGGVVLAAGLSSSGLSSLEALSGGVSVAAAAAEAPALEEEEGVEEAAVLELEELELVTAGVAGEGWAAAEAALGFATMTTTKFFSSILYSFKAVSSLRILPAYINFCPATGKPSFPFSFSIFSFKAFTVSSPSMSILNVCCWRVFNVICIVAKISKIQSTVYSDTRFSSKRLAMIPG